jgi:hypothetical protein
MKVNIFLSFLLVLFFSAVKAGDVDKQAFYKVFSSGSKDHIDDMISKLEQEKTSSLVMAYQGALHMKRAVFLKGVGAKVKTFKKGAQLLEEEIKKNPSNAEYRFLRLAIQEHAPGILHYDKNLDEDKSAVTSGFAKFNANLKTVVTDYAKDSKVLKESDFR